MKPFIRSINNQTQFHHEVSRNELFSAITQDDEDIFPSNQQINSSFDNSLRYTHWTGRNFFCCFGMFMLGSQKTQVILTCLLIIITWISYVILIIPYLRSNWLTRVSLILMSINVNFLLITAFTEPGIIPRVVRLNSSIDPIYHTYLRRNAMKLNYCMTCKIIKPIRTRHCKYCDNCVQMFDHHCPWIGNCIGIRNYFFFFCFVSSVVIGLLMILGNDTKRYINIRFLFSYHTLSLMITIGSSGIVLFQCIYRVPTNRPILRLVSISIMIPWSLTVILFAGSLLLFHIILIIRRQSTSEFFKGIHIERESVSNSDNSNDRTVINRSRTSRFSTTIGLSLFEFCKPNDGGIMTNLSIVSSNDSPDSVDHNRNISKNTLMASISSLPFYNISSSIEKMYEYPPSKFACLCPPNTLLLPMYLSRNSRDVEMDNNLVQHISSTIQRYLEEP